jgi:hypothetical protein
MLRPPATRSQPCGLPNTCYSLATLRVAKHLLLARNPAGCQTPATGSQPCGFPHNLTMLSSMLNFGSTLVYLVYTFSLTKSKGCNNLAIPFREY